MRTQSQRRLIDLPPHVREAIAEVHEHEAGPHGERAKRKVLNFDRQFPRDRNQDRSERPGRNKSCKRHHHKRQRQISQRKMWKRTDGTEDLLQGF